MSLADSVRKRGADDDGNEDDFECDWIWPRRTDVAAAQAGRGAASAGGEDLETVSRSLGVTAATLTAWRDSFLAAGKAALAARLTDGETIESERLKARLGEMLLKHELLEQNITPWRAAALVWGRSCQPVFVDGLHH